MVSVEPVAVPAGLAVFVVASDEALFALLAERSTFAPMGGIIFLRAIFNTYVLRFVTTKLYIVIENMAHMETFPWYYMASFVIFASPNTLDHSAKLRLVVVMPVRSQSLLSGLNSNAPPVSG